MKKVSVVMPAYNAEKYLATAIESVLTQTCQDFEFIIIDDGSSDNTLKIINEFAARDKRIKVISHENMGMGNSLNKAIAKAEGEWIARIDADDMMMPERLERQLAFIHENEGIAVASSLVYYLDENDRVIGKNKSNIVSADDCKKYLKSNELIGFHHPAVIMSKAVFLEVGGYRPEFWPADDIDLWNRIVEKKHILLVQQEYLTKYRIHLSSVTISDSRKVRQRVRWLKSCMIQRRNGKKEPNWAGFLEAENNKSLWKKINQERKDLAKILYKKGTYFYSTKSYIKFIFTLMSAGFFQPGYLFSQLYFKSLGSAK